VGGKKEEVMQCYEVVEKKILTADLSSVKEVPAEEAEVEIKNISKN